MSGGGSRTSSASATAARATVDRMTSAAHQDSLQVLREYRNLAPWNLRDLAGLVGAVLDASAVTPINAAARAQPSQRTVQLYVTRGLMSTPEARATPAASLSRHF